MNRKLLSLIIAGCVIALVTTLPIPSTSALEMEYFPLAPGAALFYNSTNDDGDWLTKRYVDEEWEFLGGPYGTFTVLWAEANMMPNETDYTWVNHMWISKTADTLLWWAFEDANAKFVSSTPLNYVTEPVTDGAVHRGTTTGTLTLSDGTVMTGIPFAANYTIEDIETVIVPAGTFEDCLKIKTVGFAEKDTSGEWLPKQTVRIDREWYKWFAPGIGIIKVIFKEEKTLTGIVLPTLPSEFVEFTIQLKTFK